MYDVKIRKKQGRHLSWTVSYMYTFARRGHSWRESTARFIAGAAGLRVRRWDNERAERGECAPEEFGMAVAVQIRLERKP